MANDKRIKTARRFLGGVLLGADRVAAAMVYERREELLDRPAVRNLIATCQRLSSEAVSRAAMYRQTVWSKRLSLWKNEDNPRRCREDRS
jgi:hypothetical protein